MNKVKKVLLAVWVTSFCHAGDRKRTVLVLFLFSWSPWNCSNINNILLFQLPPSLPSRSFNRLFFTTLNKPASIHVHKKLLLPLILFFHILEGLRTSFSTLLLMMSHSNLKLSFLSNLCTATATLVTFKLVTIISKLSLKNWKLAKIEFSA